MAATRPAASAHNHPRGLTGKVRIDLLGTPKIDTANGALSGGKPVLFGAALYLGLHRGRLIARRDLAAMLWPDADGATRGERMRWLLHRLRQAGLPIEPGAPEIGLSRDAVSLDVDELDAATSPAVVLEMARQAPLAAYEPAISDTFSLWLEDTRDSLRAQLIRSLAQWLAVGRRAGDLPRVEEIARALLSLDPLHEGATLSLAEVLAMQGRYGSAEEVLARYSAETGRSQPQALRLMRERVREMASRASSDRPRTALIGRGATVAQLLGRLQEPGHAAALFAVAGPSGIGKSRVLEEVATIAPLRGARVARARCDRADTLRPLSLVVDVARQLLMLRGAIGASPASIETLRRLLGDHVEQEDDVPYEARRAAVHAALRDVLEALGDDGPVIVIADDVQWAEAGSWGLLSLLMGTQPRVSWLFGIRADSMEAASGLTRRIAGADDAARCDVELLWLPPLAASAVAALAEAHSASRALPAQVRDAIVERAAGIPFVVQALVEHWRSTGDLASLPPSVARLVAARLERLSAPAMRILEAIAVLGADAELPGVEVVSTLTRAAMLEATRELESAGILQRADRVLSAHALWTEAVMARVPSSTLHLLHRSAAEWLESLSAEASAPDHRRHWAIASHWLEATDAERARRSLDSAADVLLANGFARHAAEMLERAAEIAGITETALAYLQRAGEMHLLEQHTEAPAAVRRLNGRYNEIGAVVLGERFTPHHELESTLLSTWLATQPRSAQVSARLECVLAEDAPVLHRLIAASRLMGQYTHHDLARGAAIRAWQVAAQLVPTTPREHHFFERCAALYHAHLMNDPARGLEHALRADAALDPSSPAYKRELFNSGQVTTSCYEQLGDLDSAQQVRRRLLAMAQPLRSQWVERMALSGLIGTAEEAGRFEEARQLLPLFTATGGPVQTDGDRAREICRVVLALEDGDAVRARAELVTPLSEADEPIGAMPQARLLSIYAHLALLESDDAMIRRLLPRLLGLFVHRLAYMDHPAYVAGMCLARLEGRAAAAAFVSEFLRDKRLERWTPRAELLALARGEDVALRRETNGADAQQKDAAPARVRS